MPSFLQNLIAKKQPSRRSIVVVSGLPRSGTSLMQAMLKAGGIEPMTDNLRLADENNPRGYYEFERVKALKDGDIAWLAGAPGKSVKVISALLQYLPKNFEYRIIFMQRNIGEVLASQKKMLADRGEPTDKVSDEQMADLFQGHLHKVQEWLKGQPNMRVLYISYNQLLADPQPELARLNQFLDNKLAVPDMVKTIDPDLYRQRKSGQA